jgi:hypothetical protein
MDVLERETTDLSQVLARLGLKPVMTDLKQVANFSGQGVVDSNPSIRERHRYSCDAPF